MLGWVKCLGSYGHSLWPGSFKWGAVFCFTQKCRVELISSCALHTVGWAQVPWCRLSVNGWMGLGECPGARSELTDTYPWDSQTWAGNPRLMYNQPSYTNSDT